MNPQKRNAQIALEPLADRLVPSAVTVDLTTRGATGGEGGELNGALVAQVDARPTGTGYIRSFVRVQSASNGSAPLQHGINTDARPLRMHENSSPQFTRSLKIDHVPWVETSGRFYREFLLDINQKSNSPLLSLDEVKLFVAGAPDLSNFDAAAGTLNGQAANWSMDGAGDAGVRLNYRLNSGSGSGDMKLLIPESAFAGAQAGQYVYLYSKFGGAHAANAGFEEWAVSTTGNFGFPTESSGGASGGGGGSSTGGTTGPLSSLSGYVYLDYGNDGVWDGVDSGIAGVTVRISGVDVNGESYESFTTTNLDGYYEFTGLKAGTYTIWEEITDPVLAGYLDGIDSLGTVDGQSLGQLGTNDQFTSIALDWGKNGVHYNFGELLPDDDS